VTLAAKDGRTQFRVGEGVEVELRLQSSAPGKYEVLTCPPERTTRFEPGPLPGQHRRRSSVTESLSLPGLNPRPVRSKLPEPHCPPARWPEFEC